ncbi:cysteine peptidase family C39 domain-containing protein, partial [Streptococcus thermophilus]|uniref:cysteine peptidase family C39 domain-containing protein n=1 Tax=Streptococcus thermophilus TaxID=1308 RepID=UPI001FC7D0AE
MKRFGVALKAYHASFRDLLQVYNEKKQRIILHWNQDHFVVLDKITEKQVTIVDPAIGRVKYSHDEFLNHYSETIVLINKDENFQTQKYKQIFWKYFKLTLKTKTIILFLLSLVLIQISVLAFSILLRYMLSEKFQFLSNILVLFGVVLFQLLGYFIKNSALNEYNLDFDDNYSKALFQKLLKKPLLYFRNHLSGGISEKINFKSTLRDNVT